MFTAIEFYSIIIYIETIFSIENDPNSWIWFFFLLFFSFVLHFSDFIFFYHNVFQSHKSESMNQSECERANVYARFPNSGLFYVTVG